MKKEMLINVLQPEESRIAIIEDGTLEELYVERISQGNLVGNIYKGRVVNIEPSIQAVFVDFGVGRNGFLHVSDVEYQSTRRTATAAPVTTTTTSTGMTAAADAAATGRAAGAGAVSTNAAPATSLRSRTSSSAAVKSWCRSSKRESAPKGPPSPRTSAFPAATWC